MTLNRRNFTVGAAGLGIASTVAGCIPGDTSNAPKPARTGKSDVIVIGAGVSGLRTAKLLEDLSLIHI